MFSKTNSNLVVKEYQDVSTVEEMNALLVAENVGKIYRYVGVSADGFVTGGLYQVIA